jgi:hypothetical protein
MPASASQPLPRRSFLVGAAATAGALALPGAARAQTAGDVQRLLVLAAQAAFAKLSGPGGFWSSHVARFGLPVLFRKTAANAAGPLGQDTFRAELQYRLNVLAETGAHGAAPAVVEAARKLAVPNPQAILAGGKPTAATSQLRLEMGSGLVNAMIPTLEQALVAAQDPVVAQAVTALAGVATRDVAHAVAIAADNGIWYEIGKAEAEIRRNPAIANDSALAAALRPKPAAAQVPPAP